jgi:hypothetical protein
MIRRELTGERHIEALKRAPNRLEAELDRATQRGAIAIARDMRAGAPKAQSLLTSSITHRRIGSAHHEVIVGAEYGAAVEYGRGPGQAMPPVRSIDDWIAVRGIEPNDPEMSQRDLAFVIARSIAREGTTAQPFFRPAIRDNENRLQQLVDVGTERALED